MKSNIDLLNLYKEEKALIIGAPDVRTGLEDFPTFKEWKVDYVREYLDTHETVSVEEADAIIERLIAEADEELERMKTTKQTVDIPFNRSAKVTAEAPRYWYHTLYHRKLNDDGSLSAYPVRPKETELLDMFPGKKDDKVIYIAQEPLRCEGSTIVRIDITSITERVRYTGQAEGYGIISGDVPADCIEVIQQGVEEKPVVKKNKSTKKKKPAVKKSTSKKDKARKVFLRHFEKVTAGKMKRKALLEKMVNQADITMNGASTYYQEFKREL